jgi:O-antigen ligase
MPLLPPASGSQRIFLLAAAAFIVVAPFPSSAGWRVFFLLVATGALAWRSLRLREASGLALVPRAFAATGITWALLCAVSIAWSIDPGYTAQELRRELFYGLLAFVVFFAATRSAVELALWLRLIFAGAFVLGICQWLRATFPDAQWANSISIGPGPFATHVAMVLPMLTIAAWPAPHGLGWRLPASIAACAVLAIMGLAGESRILWFALIAAALVAFVLFAAGLPRGHRARTIATRAFVAGVALLVVLMAVSTENKLRVYPGASTTREMLALDERPVIWKLAVEEATHAPVLGHGYGRDIAGAHMRQGLENAGAMPYNHGHSVFLDTAIQLGLVGLAVFIAMMGSLVAGLAAVRRMPAGAPIAIAGLAMITAYALKDVTDDFYFRPNSLIFWAMAGMLLGRAARLKSSA